MLANLYDTYADVLLDGGEGVLAAKYMKKSLEASQAAAEKEVSAQTRLLLALRLKEKVRVKEKEKEHTRQLLRLENSEKQRVAMQLHDLIGPVKNMILQQLGEVEKTDSTVIAGMKTQLTNLAASLRTLSHRMNQAMLEQLTLAEILAHGSDRRQIAEALGIHPSAVDKSFVKMRQDFNCKNNYELIRVLTDNSIV
jgi:hypothetical protein